MRGLTVAEVLVAVALFAGAMVAIIGVFPISARAARQAQFQLAATELVSREIETTRAYGYDQIAAGPPSTTTLNFDQNGAPLKIDYRLTTTVSSPTDGLKHISTLAQWYGPDGLERNLRMETDVARLTP